MGGYIFSSGQFLFVCYISELHPWLHHSPAPEAGGEQAEPIPSSLLHSQVAAGTPTDSLSCTNSSTHLTSLIIGLMIYTNVTFKLTLFMHLAKINTYNCYSEAGGWILQHIHLE